jgi:MFS family permease
MPWSAGDSIRVLSVVDVYTRECLALELDTSFASRRVMRVLDAIIAQRGIAGAIRCDSGPEFTSRHFLAWAVERQIELIHIQPGKPTQKFLSTVEGLDLRAIGMVAWVPFLFSDIGSLGGGWLAGRFIRRGTKPVQARLKVMAGCACVGFFSFTIYFAHSLAIVVGLMSLMMLSAMAANFAAPRYRTHLWRRPTRCGSAERLVEEYRRQKPIAAVVVYHCR